MSYMSQSEDKAPPLSPLPKVKPHPPQSPLRKVSDHHTVFIRPLKMTPSDEVMFNPQSPHKPLCYSFSRSPAKVSYDFEGKKSGLFRFIRIYSDLFGFIRIYLDLFSK